LVAAADAIFVQASSKKGEEAAEAFAHAARLRQASYRTYGKHVDALEAMELWSEAADRSEGKACDFGIELANLRAQVGGDPDEQYRDYYLLRERFQGSACHPRLERGLGILTAYRPTPEKLRELRLSADKHGKNAKGQVTHQSLSQTVVPPDVLRASLESPTEISKVEPFSAERTARVVVHVTHPTRFQVGSLKSTEDKAPRLFVDIEHASFRGQEVIESKGLVQRVRLGKKDGSTRVVLDLSKEAHHRVFYLPEPFRLVIDLGLDELEQSETLRQIRRVVLDPGHGGHDPGAVGPNGLREKDVALDIAHRAAPLLAREVGVSTLLTRDVDAFIPLDERAARANAFHADLFVSIHLNSSEDKDSKGVMTFVLDTSRDAAASKIAARENSSTEAAAAELANSLSRIQSESRRAASETFAKLLQRSAGASLRQNYRGVSDHGVRSAGFYVLAGASMPAVLFEGSFISNPLEAQRLNSEDYRQRLADAVVNAVRAYRDGL